MILIYDTVSVIQSEFPFIVYQMQAGNEANNVFKAVGRLANYTKSQLLDGNDIESERCFQIAYDIFEHGSNISKLAIENIFVYSVSRLLETSFSVSHRACALFLKFFRKQYEAQIGAKYP